MTRSNKNVVIVIAILAAVIAAVAIKEMQREAATKATPNPPPAGAAAQRGDATVATLAPTVGVDVATAVAVSKKLPKLVDLGAGKCIPCKMMAPIMEELQREYAQTFSVQFIDVWKDPEPGRKYGIRVIPTQIFFDAEGQELFRHEGFFSKEDILKTWQKYGVGITNAGCARNPSYDVYLPKV